MTAYSAGYYVGGLLFLLVLALVFWFVGRWGWIGLLIRIVCAALFALKVLSLLAYAPSS
jgi:hypothetical protein